jgi:DMSO/TMAO reductase YedYZ molybdopterin-dependent catalytic subunit
VKEKRDLPKEAWCAMKRYYSIMLIIGVALVISALSAHAVGRVRLAPDTPDSKIIHMHPKDIDPSLLPLDSIEDLHTTGSPQKVDISSWQLEIRGKRLKNPRSLGYQDLLQMEMIRKKAILICPGFFVDYAEWEGVPLSTILERVGVKADYQSITFHALDGYSSSFSRDEVEDNLLFLALKVNGETLPEEHGFPVRLVAEDILGGRWVKWIKSIEVK